MPLTFTLRPQYAFWFQGGLLLCLTLMPWVYLVEQVGQYFLNAPQPFPWLLLYLCLGASLLLVACFSFFWWRWRQARLTFTETELIYQGYLSLHGWRYPYSAITHVVTYAYGAIMFKTTNGSTHLLSLTAWQGAHTTALAELRRRLPPERFAPNLAQLGQVGWREVVTALSVLGYFLFYFYFLGTGSYWVRDHLTWPRFYGAVHPFVGSSVESLSLDEQGRPSLVVQPDVLVPKAFEVRQYGATGVQTWAVPASTDWGIFADEELLSMRGVVFDAHNRPQILVSDFFRERLLVWDGARWQLHPSPLGAESQTVLVRGPHVWATVETSPIQWVYWNTQANFTTTLAVPVPVAEARFKPYSIALTPDYQLLVAADTLTATHVLRYPLGLTATLTPTAETLLIWPEAQGSVRSVAQAPDGAVWLWLYASNDQPNAIVRYQLATDTWQTYIAPAAECCDMVYRSDFWVDKHNRVWAPTNRGLVVLAADAPGVLQILNKYTDKNSNVVDFITLHSPQLGPDGRLWVYNSAVVWADTTAATLPAAVPAWLAFSFASIESFGLIMLWLVPLLLVESLNYLRARLQLAPH